MEMFKEGDLVFAKVTSRVPPWPAEVTKCLANNFYQVKCFGTDTVSDVKATAIVTYSSFSRARFDSSRNRKVKHFDLALHLIRAKRRECECSSGCSVPIQERKKVKLTVCEEGENEISDIAKLKLVKKGKTLNKSGKTPNKKRKAEAISVEKETAVNVRGILTNRIAAKIISPVPKRRRTVNFAQRPSSDASAVSFENNTSTPLLLSGFYKGEARRQINFQNENITDRAFNIVEELDETRDTIKKIMNMNQSKELTIHYLSLLMNEKKLVDEHKQDKMLIDKEYDKDENLVNSEHDKGKEEHDVSKVAAEIESYSETADNSIFQSDNILHEEQPRMTRKKKITFKSAKCLYNDEIDKDQTLLDYSDYNNCHQLAVDDQEHQSDNISTTKVPLDQMEVSSDPLHPATIVNPTILAEMVQAKDESSASSLLLRNISRSLDVNSNKDCNKSLPCDSVSCDSVFDALANQAKRETIDIVTSNVHLTNVIRELTAKAVVSYDGEMPEDEDVEKPIVEEDNLNVKEEKPIVDDVKPVVDDILQKSLDGSNSSNSDVEVSSDDFSESED